MYVTVHARDTAARDLAGGKSRSPGTSKLRAVLSEMGVHLEPIHPGTSDPELAKHFTVRVPDRATGERVCKKLMESGLVEAAYLKPPDAAP